MPRSFSAEFIDAMNSLNNDEAFLILLTMTHSSFPEPLRLVGNNVNMNSRGNEYEAVGFQFTFPIDDNTTLPVAKLQIDNVDLRLVETIRTITGAIEVLVEVISHARPDDVEIALPNMKLRGVDWDTRFISGSLVIDDIMNMRYPADRIVPREYPGLF